METLKTLEIILAVLLVLAVLMQNKEVALNLSSMSGGANATEKRGPEKFLHIATIVLWTLFVVNSIILFIYS